MPDVIRIPLELLVAILAWGLVALLVIVVLFILAAATTGLVISVKQQIAKRTKKGRN